MAIISFVAAPFVGSCLIIAMLLFFTVEKLTPYKSGTPRTEGKTTGILNKYPFPVTGDKDRIGGPEGNPETLFYGNYVGILAADGTLHDAHPDN
jgi:hypothetical protein